MPMGIKRGAKEAVSQSFLKGSHTRFCSGRIYPTLDMCAMNRTATMAHSLESLYESNPKGVILRFRNLKKSNANPKFEARNSKQIRNPKFQCFKHCLEFGYWDLSIVSDF